MAYTTIDNPGLFFNTLLYAGNSSTGHSITGVGFQPDWVWIRERDASNHHIFVDAVRGATKYLLGNDGQAEVTSSNYVSSLDSDGFTLGSDAGVNRGSMLAWNWKANGSGSSNGDGSITSTVSVNTTSGFSIVSYTGTGSNATVGHSLGTTPSMIIFKNRDSVTDWRVYHKNLGATKGIRLSSDGAEQTSSTYFNDTEPTSSLFTVSTAVDTNESGSKFIAYCLAEKQGYSKIGSYTGNGNADGAFIHTGFRPARVMIKKSSGTNEWGIWDNKRSTFNVTNDIIYANLTNAEATDNSNGLDFVSNGFKIRASGDLFNASSGSYIYMAFAEHPFVTEGTKAAGTAR